MLEQKHIKQYCKITTLKTKFGNKINIKLTISDYESCIPENQLSIEDIEDIAEQIQIELQERRK